MYQEDEDIPKRAALVVVFGVVAVVVTAVLAYGAAHRSAARSAQSASSSLAVLAAATALVVAAPVADAFAAQLAASDAASINVENGVVKFYFAPSKAELAAGANDALANVVKQVTADDSLGRKLVVSGFHDATGNAAKNVELAKLRAKTVRSALLALGVAEGQIELKKPEQLLASETNAQARRVEVSVQ